MLRRRGVGGEREQRLIHGAYESAERAKLLVHRLLAFARRQPLQSVPIDVGDLIAGLADLVATAAGPQVAVTLDIADGLPPAQADPRQLEMAIVNLCVNARDAIEGAGAIRISATLETAGSAQAPPLTPGRYIRVAIADTGKGMDEATRTRAIEPFFSTKGIGEGTGLGLSMAHGLASQLGGILTIDSEPGVGTEVAMWLPESDRPAQSDAAPEPTLVSHTHAGSALVVDDEAYIRASIVDMLTELGFTVREAATRRGRPARHRRRLQAGHFDHRPSDAGHDGRGTRPRGAGAAAGHPHPDRFRLRRRRRHRSITAAPDEALRPKRADATYLWLRGCAAGREVGRGTIGATVEAVVGSLIELSL